MRDNVEKRKKIRKEGGIVKFIKKLFFLFKLILYDYDLRFIE